MDEKKESLSYAQAGVDIEAGNALVERIKPAAAKTTRPGVMAGLGGFGALFDLKATGLEDPVLVAATDGVGTKLRIGIETDALDGLGIDLVAMCVNDLVCQGAEPLFFLDYFATGALSTERAARVVEGIARGCEMSGCALIGGETAEMPGMYAPGDFDLAGFAVGAVERTRVLPADISEGDVLLGLASDGAHSNGFSLLRALADRAGLGWDDPCPFDPAQTLGAALLTPTRIYVRPVLSALAAGGVQGLAHITGGGLLENLPRILPEGLGAEVDLSAFPLPPVFAWAREEGNLPQDELLTTFNAGIGMVLVVRAAAAAAIREGLRAQGETVSTLGQVVARPGLHLSGELR